MPQSVWQIEVGLACRCSHQSIGWCGYTRSWTREWPAPAPSTLFTQIIVPSLAAHTAVLMHESYGRYLLLL